MSTPNAVSEFHELPCDATNGEAIAWVGRMRRLLDRWETLPGYECRLMTPERKQRARAELDELERDIRRNMHIAIT